GFKTAGRCADGDDRKRQALLRREMVVDGRVDGRENRVLLVWGGAAHRPPRHSRDRGSRTDGRPPGLACGRPGFPARHRPYSQALALRRAALAAKERSIGLSTHDSTAGARWRSGTIFAVEKASIRALNPLEDD